jgi:HPt (histidine-containing phosphotransfer) domain-containing protein
MGDPSLDDALARIWQRAQPKMLERCDAIDRAIDALGGSGDPDTIEEGRAEAHKIAGLAGTFDLAEGTRLAREIEYALEEGGADPAELRPRAAELRAILSRDTT